jgi:alpha-galactosidase
VQTIRFSGEFRIDAMTIEVAVNTEGLRLNPGESWDLEEFSFAKATDREELLGQLASQIQKNHPSLPVKEFPTGWCSWYYYFEDATEEDIRKNVQAIAQHVPALRYIQIDDGYQAAMGDWFESGPRFPNGVASVLAEITRAGFSPGIWVAPFIAQKESRIFRQHPDWFIQDDGGTPLASDTVSFGGWRLGPWYALDGTHPEVQDTLRNSFGECEKNGALLISSLMQRFGVPFTEGISLIRPQLASRPTEGVWNRSFEVQVKEPTYSAGTSRCGPL